MKEQASIDAKKSKLGAAHKAAPFLFLLQYVGMERFKVIPDVFLMLMKDGKVLLLRRANTGYADGLYSFVAGHAEEHEPMSVAMAREALEEGGITIKPKELRHVVTMQRNQGDHERVGFFFTADSWEGEIKNMEPDFCDDLSWFSLNELPPNMIDYIRVAIECYKNGTRYLEFGF